jgi:hypothetical protein
MFTWKCYPIHFLSGRTRTLVIINKNIGVTGYGVAKRKLDDGSWIKEPDFFALRV